MANLTSWVVIQCKKGIQISNVIRSIFIVLILIFDVLMNHYHESQDKKIEQYYDRGLTIKLM